MSESKLRLYAHIPSQPQHNTGRGGHYKLKNMIDDKKIEDIENNRWARVKQ